MRRTLLLTLAVLAATVLGPVTPTAAQDVPDVVMAVVDVGSAGDATFDAAGWAIGAATDTAPFAMVAVEMPGEQAVEVRTALGEGAWSAWTELPHQHDEGPDPTGAEAAAARDGHRTALVHTGPADRLQVRTDGDPAALRAHLVDPFGLGRGWWEAAVDRAQAAWRGTPAATATALADTPPIVSRAAWGADESIVRGTPSYARDVERAFVHHTVGSNTYTQAQAPGIVRGIQAFHVNGNGWSDIGYNFLVDRFGTIYEGRAGGIDRAVIGAQAGGFNTQSTGIALMGTFTSAGAGPAALEAAASVLAWKADVHHFHPLRSGQATSMGSSRYPEGTVVTLANVSGHRDVSTTSCPGDVTYGQLASIRDRVRDLAGDLVVDQASDVTATRAIRGNPDVDAITFTGELDPPGDWSVEVRDSAGAVRHTEEGTGGLVRSTMPLPGDDWPLGTYTWALSSPGRRTATGTVRVQPPVIGGLNTSQSVALVDADGTLAQPLAIGADLWDAATWQLQITDPSGQVVHTAAGQGARLDTGWFAGATDPGTYEIRVTAEDAEPAIRIQEVRIDLLDEVGGADDPVGGAALLSGAAFAAGQADRAVIARADVFADALAGGPLAGTGGPLLLTAPDALDGRVTAELDRVLAPGAPIYVLGGSAAIGEAVVDQLRARYGDVIRLAGDSRFATAAAIAEQVVEESGATTAMIARAGPDDAAPWADAIAGGAYGAAVGVPVLLTDTDRLSEATADALDVLGIDDTIVLGGTAAVSQAVEARLPSPTRVAGPDRAATAAAIARQLWPAGSAEVVLANGYAADAWTYALAAAPLAARRGAPLLVVEAASLPPATRELLAATAATGGLLVGPARLADPEVGYAASDLLRR